MKLSLTIVLLSAACITIQAAPVITKKVNDVHGMMYMNILRKQAESKSVSKTTAALKRLSATSYVANGGIVDSNHFYYSKGRGSVLGEPESYGDNYYPLAIDAGQTISSDSSVKWENIGGSFDKGTSKAYIYNSGNQAIEADYIPYWGYNKYINTYNTAGYLETVTTLDTSGTNHALASLSTMYISYDASGRRLKDSSKSISKGIFTYKRDFFYDPAGNLINMISYFNSGSGFVMSYRSTNTYDASNRLLLTIDEVSSAGTMQYYSKDSFTYTGTNTKPTLHDSYFFDAGTSIWNINQRYTFTYNAVNNVDTYYLYRDNTGTGVLDTIERDIYTYNTDGFISRINGYLYKGNGTYASVPYDQTTHYFEEYYPVAVSHITQTSPISLHPNPASGILNINTGTKQTSNYSIIDMQGRLMSKAVNINSNSFKADISNLSTGNYIIQLLDTENKPLGQQEFTKQ